MRYWLHCELLKVEGETMSKSKGNYFTFRDLRPRVFQPPAIRYFLLSVPYRKQLNFTFDALARRGEDGREPARLSRAFERSQRQNPAATKNCRHATERALQGF